MVPWIQKRVEDEAEAARKLAGTCRVPLRSDKKRRRSEEKNDDDDEDDEDDDDKKQEVEKRREVVATGQCGTPRPSKRRRVKVLSSPSADQQPASAGLSSSGSPLVSLVPIVVSFPKSFPPVVRTSWKRLSVKQLQLEILLCHFDDRTISFDVSWNDIPSYHTHFAFGNDVASNARSKDEDKPWCNLM